MEIRQYKPSDKAYLQDICRKTASGIYTKNGRLQKAVTIIYNDYFTEQESGNIFVLANDSGVPVGYILCSADYDNFVHKMKTVYGKRLLKICPSQIFALNGYLFSLKKIRHRAVHLHIDILPQYQRQGWGRRLIDTLSNHLRENGIDHLSVCAVSRNSDGYKMYVRLGFKEIMYYGTNTVSLSKPLS